MFPYNAVPCFYHIQVTLPNGYTNANIHEKCIRQDWVSVGQIWCCGSGTPLCNISLCWLPDYFLYRICVLASKVIYIMYVFTEFLSMPYVFFLNTYLHTSHIIYKIVNGCIRWHNQRHIYKKNAHPQVAAPKVAIYKTAFYHIANLHIIV